MSQFALASDASVPAANLDGLVRSAAAEAQKGWMRIPITVVASGLLWRFVGGDAAAMWLCVMLGLELGAAAIRIRLANGAIRLGSPYLIVTAAISAGWVVLALLLWNTPDEAARISAIVSLFSVASYGVFGAHQDARILAVLLAPQLTTLALILLSFAWSLGDALTALIVSIASVGAAGTVALNAWKLNAAAATLRAANQDLDRERRSLERRVQERTRDLEWATVAAQAASDAKSRFLATMSHELRTPLSSILGYADLIDDSVAAGETPERGDVDKIRNAGARLLRMVDNVLAMAALETTAASPVTADVSTRDLLQTLAAGAACGDNRVTVHVDDDALHVRTDPDRVRQAVAHLLDNACKFTRAGEIELRAAKSQDPLLPIEISVRDSGEGMSPDMMARIGGAFEQGAGGFDRPHEGAGLGLAITHRLVQSLGGRLVIVSERNRGVTASILLARG